MVGGRAGLEYAATLDDVLRRLTERPARTVIFDVEPLVAYWDNGQDALDRGVTLVLDRMRRIPAVQVVCFATNSRRRPSVTPVSSGVRVVYLATAHKPLVTAPYRTFPRPGVVIGDQIATDGVLARRLGYAFVQYSPPSAGLPPGPYLMRQAGRLLQPLLFIRQPAGQPTRA